MSGFRFNWRWLLVLLGIAIVCGTIFYSQFLAQKIRREEQQKIEQWLAASKAVINPDLTLPNLIRNEQHSIPIIETNENDSITSYFNLDTVKIDRDKIIFPDNWKFFVPKILRLKSNGVIRRIRLTVITTDILLYWIRYVIFHSSS
ncbi:MAG: hypothetical protein WDM78_07880 [Puia sp.]